MKCKICGSKKTIIFWDKKIRGEKDIFKFLPNKTNKNPIDTKEIVYKCKKCEVAFLKNQSKYFEIESTYNHKKIYHNLKYQDLNTIEKFKNIKNINSYIAYHRKNEKFKYKFIKKNIKIKNRNILQSKCGLGILLDNFKESKITAGLDIPFYENKIKKKHIFFKNYDQIIKKKIKFDLVTVLGEFEHKSNPILFFRKIKSVLKRAGKVVLRVPNLDNIYNFLLGDHFLKYDLRKSHNFYYNKKSLKILFDKVGLDIIKIFGYQEYNLNHLLTYLIKKRRVNKSEIKNIMSENSLVESKKNIEKNLVSTSFILILKKN